LLGNDKAFVAMASRFFGQSTEIDKVVAELVRDEHIPCSPALRYTEAGLRRHVEWALTWQLQVESDESGERVDFLPPSRYGPGDFSRPSYWRLRSKFDVPSERFISYPLTGSDAELVLGWAGWSAAERAIVIMDLIADQGRIGDEPESVIALLAALRELLVWLRKWHKDPEPPLWLGSPADETAYYLARELYARRLTLADLAQWRPPKRKRGRPRKSPVKSESET